MRKMKNYLKIGILLFGISLVLITCKKEKSATQQSNLETLSTEEVISYFEMQKTSSKANFNNKKQVTPNFKGITQEKIINSSALLTIIPTTTIYTEHYSRILMLKINQEIQAIVFSMYPSKKSNSENFSGEIMITDLDGNFLNGYRVFKGKLKTQFRAKTNENKSSFNYISSVSECKDHGNCISGSSCILCIQQLNEVVVVSYAPMSSNYIYINRFFSFSDYLSGGQYIDENWSYGGGGGGPGDYPPPLLIENPPTPQCPTTETELGNMFPSASSGNLTVLKNTLNQHSGSFGIDNKDELQHFLSQAGHESAGFQNLSGEENLYYTSPARLMEVWPSRFSQTDPNKKDPDDYIRNAKKLANLIYANRMGNGDEASGDGYAYRGRGIFQLTGKDNYSDFASFYNVRFSTNHTATSAADLLSSDYVASIISALWFYKEHVLSKITVDENTTVKSVTKLINDGLNGISDRISKMALAILNINC
jgi:putative chitinase